MLSIVIPLYNEVESLDALVQAIDDQYVRLNDTIEVILVDDGSTDGSWNKIESLCEADFRVQCIGVRLRRNCGKASALSAGFRQANGEIIISMDADLQDDPAEISKLLQVMDQGDYDLVSGWKQHRQDPLEKVLPSKFFNWTTRLVTGVKLHDFNCGLKAYRSRAVKDLHLYGELHRYTPILVKNKGYKVGEAPVAHKKRQFGHSKFGVNRYVRGMLDLFTVVAITRFLHRPGHLFGGMGLLFGVLGGGILSYLSMLWFMGVPVGGRPLFFLGILLVIVAFQLISLGLLGEMFLHLNLRKFSSDIVDCVKRSTNED